mmetsp:Transcript_8814/g.7789  ORF Transcript_8814/g.7789 Transcript_8814/m.7789 type:complete len:96 (+) Transcript_8814:1794-2081(+)
MQLAQSSPFIANITFKNDPNGTFEYNYVSEIIKKPETKKGCLFGEYSKTTLEQKVEKRKFAYASTAQEIADFNYLVKSIDDEINEHRSMPYIRVI